MESAARRSKGEGRQGIIDFAERATCGQSRDPRDQQFVVRDQRRQRHGRRLLARIGVADIRQGVVAAGHYEDTLRKVAGVWKFAEAFHRGRVRPDTAPHRRANRNSDPMIAKPPQAAPPDFRELLKKPPFVCMGAHDAVTAKLAEQAGAPAIYVSGFVACGDRSRAARLRRADPDRDVRAHPAHLPRHDACRCSPMPTRLRRRARRAAHDPAVGGGRRLGAAPRRPGHAEEVRPLRRQAADPRRGDAAEAARDARGAARSRTSSSSPAPTRWASRTSTTRFAGSSPTPPSAPTASTSTRRAASSR